MPGWKLRQFPAVVWVVSWSLFPSISTGQIPVKGYPTSLRLDQPILAGSSQTITGSGAPPGSGNYVELWRVSGETARAEAVASVEASDGEFAFSGVAVQEGETYHVTLSRGWLFNRDGDAEGWGDCPGCLSDLETRVENGVLQLTLTDLDGDDSLFPAIQNLFEFDGSRHRVMEIRMRNLSAYSTLGIFWSKPGVPSFFAHIPVMPMDNLLFPNIPAEADGFQTILYPMNTAELDLGAEQPVSADGLWAGEVHNDSLMLAPFLDIPFLPPPEGGGVLLEIDSIRIREDYRLDFNDDLQGMDIFNDCADVEVGGGFIRYAVGDFGPPANPQADGLVDAYFLTSLLTGFFEVSYFTRLAAGIDHLEIAHPITREGGSFTTLGFFFEDRDSNAYWDDGGSPEGTLLQFAAVLVPAVGRIDGARRIDSICVDPQTGDPAIGEWSEDGIPRAQGLSIEFPDIAEAGDHAEMDYLAFIPDNPFGPSDPVVASGPASVFRRGDADGIGDADISDAIFILRHQFLGDAGPACPDAADVDDSGAIDISDPINLLAYLFLGGTAPPAPGTAACGIDATGDDELGACTYPQSQCRL